jgi:hypothetical protein
MLALHRRNTGQRGRTVLVAGPDRWVLVPTRVRDRLLAGWRALDLDAQLAAGEPETANRLRAVRAGMLVEPLRRRQLAASWADLLAASVHPTTSQIWMGVPVQRARIVAAAHDIERLADALREAGPVPARGVAIATLLLTNGASPVYARSSRVDLRAALRTAADCLDPSTTFTDS